jgi:hypothetical protein
MKSKISVIFIAMLLLLSYGCGKMDEEKAAEIILNSASNSTPVTYMDMSAVITRFNSVEVLELHRKEFYVGQLEGIITTSYDLEMVDNAKAFDQEMAFVRCRLTADVEPAAHMSAISGLSVTINEDFLLDEPAIVWIWLVETDKGWKVDVLGIEEI